MRYADILINDTANGPGLRVTLFTQGCPIHCDKCHNPELWDFAGGQEYTQETEDKIIKLLESKYIRGLSILGGEPLIPQNLEQLSSLITRTKELGKDVWLWTGYQWEDIIHSGDEKLLNVTQNLDVMVDGPFEIDRAGQDILFRGSANQRLLDVQKSIEVGQPVEIENTSKIQPKC